MILCLAILIQYWHVTDTHRHTTTAYTTVVQGVPIKNTLLEKIPYFSSGSTDFSQTFKLCMWILTRHIMWILLK